MKIEEFKNKLQKKIIENEINEDRLNEYQNQLDILSNKLSIGQEALQYVEDISNSKRNVFKNQLEIVISEAIKEIYHDKYRVEIDYSVKNNRSFVDILLISKIKEGVVRCNMDHFGGGISDIISIPLRFLMILKSSTSKVCLLDEGYKHLSASRIENAGRFLRKVVEKMGIQTIMVTHHKKLLDFADCLYTIEDKNGLTCIEQMN